MGFLLLRPRVEGLKAGPTLPLLPPRADNDYRGQRLALWLLGLVLLVKGSIGVNSILNGSTVATSADGIPLDTFTSAGAQTVVALFGLLGISHLVLVLAGALILVRYRSLVPLVFALLLLEQLAKRAFVAVKPVARTGQPPGPYVILGILALTVVGLSLSLWPRRTAS
jgi:hypothetical protein